jgi:hypothetical protein
MKNTQKRLEKLSEEIANRLEGDKALLIGFEVHAGHKALAVWSFNDVPKEDIIAACYELIKQFDPEGWSSAVNKVLEARKPVEPYIR